MPRYDENTKHRYPHAFNVDHPDFNAGEVKPNDVLMSDMEGWAYDVTEVIHAPGGDIIYLKDTNQYAYYCNTKKLEKISI
jgi:hypothetical protein